MSAYRHASALVIGERGLLLMGPSGAGKSALAGRLIAEARAQGLFARLIGDDRVAIARVGNRLLVSGHPAIAGRIEQRGIGILPAEPLEKAVLSGVVALEATPERLPDSAAREIGIEGIRLPRLVIRDDRDLAAKAHLVLDWMAR